MNEKNIFYIRLVLATALSIIIWLFAPIENNRFKYDESWSLSKFFIHNVFYFLPTILSGLFSGSIHYFNVFGFVLGIALESYWYALFLMKIFINARKIFAGKA
jgi:hypothetical protein